ncbi:hypothetical protein VTL71DRAFT_12336 [Oculimacula yallundae]|uniref:CCHC-type domain-containing protein n=1 Tax=Oculimacula yallundae TaxID=86028 RepID=A0ABR4CPF6_9HELO
MSYTSQMPLMRARAIDEGTPVDNVLKYYRVSLLRAQVRLDLDLSGQQFVAEHQTWTSFCLSRSKAESKEGISQQHGKRPAGEMIHAGGQGGYVREDSSENSMNVGFVQPHSTQSYLQGGFPSQSFQAIVQRPTSAQGLSEQRSRKRPRDVGQGNHWQRVGTMDSTGKYVSPRTPMGSNGAPAQNFGRGPAQQQGYFQQGYSGPQPTLPSQNPGHNPFPALSVPLQTANNVGASDRPSPSCKPPHEQAKTGRNNKKQIGQQNIVGNDDRVIPQGGDFMNPNQHQWSANIEGGSQGQAGSVGFANINSLDNQYLQNTPNPQYGAFPATFGAPPPAQFNAGFSNGNSFGHPHGPNTQDYQQGEFPAGYGAQPPAQYQNYAGTQVDGFQPQPIHQYCGQGTPDPSFAPPGPMVPTAGDPMIFHESNTGGQRGGLQNRRGGFSQRQQRGNTRRPQMQQQPGRNTDMRFTSQPPPAIQSAVVGPGGYCVNCQSRGHVLEECEGQCKLCRAGGHKAKVCQYVGLGSK